MFFSELRRAKTTTKLIQHKAEYETPKIKQLCSSTAQKFSSILNNNNDKFI